MQIPQYQGVSFDYLTLLILIPNCESFLAVKTCTKYGLSMIKIALLWIFCMHHFHYVDAEIKYYILGIKTMLKMKFFEF